MIKEIECTLIDFLWSGSELNHSGAKVKWAQICCPKEEGGLAFGVWEDKGLEWGSHA